MESIELSVVPISLNEPEMNVLDVSLRDMEEKPDVDETYVTHFAPLNHKARDKFDRTKPSNSFDDSECED